MLFFFLWHCFEEGIWKPIFKPIFTLICDLLVIAFYLIIGGKLKDLDKDNEEDSDE